MALRFSFTEFINSIKKFFKILPFSRDGKSLENKIPVTHETSVSTQTKEKRKHFPGGKTIENVPTLTKNFSKIIIEIMF